MPKRLTNECQELLTQIMEVDPDKRLTTEQIKQHDWYRRTNKIVYEAQGLIIGKNEIPIEPSMLIHLEKFGFKADFATQCLNRNKHTQVTTVYYLLHKKFEKEGKLESGFKVESTPQKDQRKNKKMDPTSAKQLSFTESVGPAAGRGG